MANMAKDRSQSQSQVFLAALDYHKRGWAVIDLEFRSKAVKESNWPQLVLDEKSLRERLEGRDRNNGVILGNRSGGLIDIDLDCPEALKLAPSFLPRTGAIFGRKSKPRSHYLYRVKSPPKTKRLCDPANATLIEIRSSGSQTVIPLSVHESGERIEWAEAGDPELVSAKKLEEAVTRLACAILVTRS